MPHVFHSLETASLPFSSFIFTLCLLWLPHVSASLSATDPHSHPKHLPPIASHPMVMEEMGTTTR